MCEGQLRVVVCRNNHHGRVKFPDFPTAGTKVREIIIDNADISVITGLLRVDAAVWAVAIPAVMFAGVSKGGFGSGAAFAGVEAPRSLVPHNPALAPVRNAHAAILRTEWRS